MSREVLFKAVEEEDSVRCGDLWIIKNYVRNMLIAAESGLDRMDFESEQKESRINQQFVKVYQNAIDALAFIDEVEQKNLKKTRTK